MLKNNKVILKNLFNVKNIIIYILALMISAVGMGQDVSPLSIAIVGACLSGGVPAILVVIAGLIGNIISVGTIGALNYILIILMLLILMFIKPPKENDEYKNEKLQISKHIFFSVIIVMVVKMIITKITFGDLLLHITLAVFSVIFYKIFVNSLVVIQDFMEKRAFSIEEVIGASLLISIAVASLGDISFFGYSIRNILSVFLVLVLGWKNGVLIGTTAGVTIGVTLGIIVQGDPTFIAIYALSGMIAGILNRFGKIGVIIGFLVGNGIILYASNGDTNNYILVKEVLIAAIGLLAVPKWVGVNVEDLTQKDEYLPAYANNRLNPSREAVDKLNDVSETIKDIAKTYEPVLNTTEELKNKNKQTFKNELLNNLDGLEDNILYNDIVDENSVILDEIFDEILEKQELDEQDIINIFAKHNNYIITKESNETQSDIGQIVKAINYAYKMSKSDFIWEEKVKTSKKNVQAQLDGVSKAISNIAVKIEEETKKDNLYIEQKKKIISLLEIKGILVEELNIEEKDNRTYIEIYLKDNSKMIENKDSDIIKQVLEKVIMQKLMVNESKNRKINKIKKIAYCYMSEDKYILQIGQSSKVKTDSSVSGDSWTQVRLGDGKVLIAISDGMGSGPKARKSSQIAIKMLERLLMSGFDKNTSIDLINTTIMNTTEDIFATLDIMIIDMFNGKIEFIKNGACPTYVKNRKKVQIVKSLSLPAGILKDINLTIYDKDIEDQDIILMCSDGILDANIEYKNKELWLKYILEDVETTNAQKIADIILNEAIDNNYGVAKDDMSLIVCKLITKNSPKST